MPVLSSDLTFQLGDTGVTLNTDSVFPFVDITQVSGLDSAPFRTSQRDHEGTDGAFIDAEFETGRDLILTGTVYADPNTMESYLDQLVYNYQPSKVRIPFYFKAPGVGERVLFVKPLGCQYNWDALRRTGQANIQFSMFAEDPRKYSSTLQTGSMIQGSTVTTGRSYNKGYNFGYNTTILVPDSTTVTNNGNREAPAIITITGPVVNPQIISDTAGKTLAFNITLSATDVLVIDLVNHTVVLNGTANRRSTLLAPNWFLLQPGVNILRFRAGALPTLGVVFTDGFESGVSGYGLTSCTFVQDGTHVNSGSQAALMTVTGTPTSAFVRTVAGQLVVPGSQYSFSMWAYATGSTPTVQATISWMDGVGGFISASTTSITLPAATETQIVATGFAPGNAASATFGPTLAGNPPTGRAIWVDDLAFSAPVPGTATISFRDTYR
jgi:hypothetical protein